MDKTPMEDKTPLQRAKSVTEIIATKDVLFPFTGEWLEAFDQPETTGVWIIWGNSANGKTSFALQLCKYLCRWVRVIYDSFEEGTGATMKKALIRCDMQNVKGRFLMLDKEPIEELNVRLKKHKSPEVVVIDSFQYTQMNKKEYFDFVRKHPNKLIIFISHADGKFPKGRTAQSVMYDASLKIYVENYRAFTKGRFEGAKGYYDIWHEKAVELWNY